MPRSLAVPEARSRRQGIVAGNAAADAMIAARQNDGRYGVSQWHPDTRAGHWWPLLDPVTMLPALDPTPWVGGVRPFLLTSSSQFRTAGPNALSSAAWAKDYNEVKAIGALNSATRSLDQTHNALFWQSNGGPALLWNDVADDLVESPSHSLDMADSARLLAMMNLRCRRRGDQCWNDKYHYDFWRPWNAIPRALEDGNDATSPDGSWTALLTAPYPEHPSGTSASTRRPCACCRCSSATTSRSASRAAASAVRRGRSATSRQPLAEIVEARIWAGLHYRTADVQSVTLGDNVVRYMTDHYFQPVGNH